MLCVSPRLGSLATMIVAVAMLADVVGVASGGQLATLPQTPNELAAWYREPPTNQNAAVMFIKAAGELHLTESEKAAVDLLWFGKAEIPPHGGSMTAAADEVLTRFMAKHSHVWPWLQRGAAIGICRYPFLLTGDFRHLQDVDAITRFAGARAVWRAAHLDNELAGEALLVTLGIVDSLTNEPLLMSQWRRKECMDYALEATQFVLSHIRLPVTQLQALQSALSRMEHAEAEVAPFRRGLIGSRIGVMGYFEFSGNHLVSLLAGTRTGERETVDQIRERLKLEVQAEDARTLNQIVEKLLDCLTEPYPKRSELLDRLERTLSMSAFEGCVVSRYVTPEFFMGLKAERILLAQMRLMEAALGVERFAASHNGDTPESLDALVPEFLASLPIDPWTGASVEYRRSGKKWAYVIRCACLDAGEAIARPGRRTNALAFVIAKGTGQLGE